MPISKKAYERLDRGIRQGLSVWSQADKEKKRREERKEIRDVELGRRKKQDARQQQRFDWEKEDRKKKKDYDVLTKEFATGDALIKAGKVREGAAMYASAYNKRWPDGAKAMLAFRSDIKDAESEKKWDRDMGLEGKEIAVTLERYGMKGFKNIDEFVKLVKMAMTPEAYLKASKETESKLADLNAKEGPFKAGDGFNYIQTWETDSGGNPKKGPVLPYKEKTPATKSERAGLRIKDYEKTTRKKLTSAEKKEIRLGIKPSKKGKTLSPGKQREDIKKQISFKLDRLGKVGGDEDLEVPGEKATISDAFDLVAKSEAGEKLTAKEQKDIKTAKEVVDLYRQYDAIGGSRSPKEDAGGGSDWRQYQQRTTSVPTPPPGPPRLGNRPATPLLR